MSNMLEQLKQSLDVDVYAKCATALPEEYLQKYKLEEITNDCNLIAGLTEIDNYAISISDGTSSDDSIWQIKLLRLNDMVSLSRGLPIIENFGFKLLDEKPFKVSLGNNNHVYICDFGVEVPDGLVSKINDPELLKKLKVAIVAAFKRDVESDSLNKLVLYSGLSARQTSLIRAVVKYLIQTNLPFSAGYISDCFKKYSFSLESV